MNRIKLQPNRITCVMVRVADSKVSLLRYARFPEFVQNFSERQIFVEFVFGIFLHFYIAIAYSMSTLCGA